MTSFRDNIKRHGLTPEQHRQMLLDQEGLCAVCGRYDALVIDHDHLCCPGKTSCGECVRGLLCNGCNTALGLLKDNQETVARLGEYLLRQPERKPRPELEHVPPRVPVSEAILDVLREADGPVGISELARRSGRSKSGVHDVIHLMSGTGVVRLTPHGYEMPT